MIFPLDNSNIGNKLLAKLSSSPYIEMELSEKKTMDQVSRFVVWICSKFDREQIQRIVKELQDVLANRNPEVKPKDDFKKNIRITGIST